MKLVQDMKSSPLITIRRSKLISNMILHALKVNPCQKLLEPVSECNQLNASSFLHILSTQDLHWLQPMCNPLMCNIVPNVQYFFEQFVICLLSPMCNTQEKIQLQNDKNERKWAKHGF